MRAFSSTIQRRGDVATGEAVRLDRARKATIDSSPGFISTIRTIRTSRPGATRVEYADRPYDEEVAWSDELVGRLLTALSDAGVTDRTLVVVTSDHGEGLGDHGEAVHGYFIYETTLHVPLVIRGPGVKPGTAIDAVTRSVDLFPTVMEMLGLRDRTPATSGLASAAALRGETGRVGGAGASGADRHAVVRRIARAAGPLRLERFAVGARRAVELHPRAEGGTPTISIAIRVS